MGATHAGGVLAPHTLGRCLLCRKCKSNQAPAYDIVPPTHLQPGGEISVMGEALDPDLMHPRTEAERRLVAQLQVRGLVLSVCHAAVVMGVSLHTTQL